MADLADVSEKDTSFLEEVGIARIRHEAQSIPKGSPGTCQGCQEYFERLVDDKCGRCRDLEARIRVNKN